MTGEHETLQSGSGPAGALPFIYGHVDPTLFPIEQLRAAADQALQTYGPLALNYGTERGCRPLLDYLQTKLTRDHGLPIQPDNLFLVPGASAGLDMVCRLYTRPGDVVLVEAPSYHEALDIIRDYPVHLSAIPIDDQGLVIEALAERLQTLAEAGQHVAMLYTIPTFQNPSGVTMSTARRRALLDLAHRHDLLIVEDDVYRNLAFTADVPPSLYALDATDHGETVIHLSSFSKILAPGLRLGWVLAAPCHTQRLISSGLTCSGGGANPFVAYTVAIFGQQGWLEPHIARLVARYRQRRDAMLTALERAMPPGVRWTHPQGGFFVWLTLPEPLRADEVLAQAHRHDITFLPGGPFFAQGGGGAHIRLPYSFIAPSEMTQGIHTLAQIIRHMLNP